MESRYRSVGVLVPVFDDEISNSKAIFWYEGTEIGLDAAVVDCGGCLVAFGAHNPR